MRVRVAALALLVGGLAGGRAPASDDAPVAHWKLDEESGRVALDSASGIEDAVGGHVERLAGVSGRGLRFDGATSHVRREAARAPALDEAFTIEAWVALQAYPWNWTALVEQAGEPLPRRRPEAPDADPEHLRPGLVGALYGEPDLTDPQGKVFLETTSADWTGGAMTWSARWRGSLEAPITGGVTIEAEADDGVTFRIDGRTVIDSPAGEGSPAGTVSLVRGRRHPILLTYHQDHGPAYLRLYWSWTGRPRILVDPGALAHDARDETLATWDVVPPREPPAEWEPRIFLGVDDHGRVGWRVVVEGARCECVSTRPLPLLEWTHVAGTFHRERGLRLYLDGQPVCALAVRGAVTPARGGDVLLGRSQLRLGPTGSERAPSARTKSAMVLDGGLDEVRIHARALTPEEVAARATEAAKAPPLEWPRLPSGPAEAPPRFTASYGRLRYTEAWEAPWRVGDRPDILIRFDRHPVRLVFWRGTSYGPAWVTENGRWMGDQSLERSGGTPLGTAEHMNDKQTRYSHVGLIEDHDARKVVHWRYALTDIGYGISRLGVDGGPGEWGDEYYTVYPDAVATRHQVLWTDDLRHEWQETIVLHPPGTRPEDNVALEAMTLANLRGETRTYSWEEGAPRAFDEPEDAHIQLTHLRSEYAPFIVFEPRPRIKPFRAAIRPEVSHFPWWNHWPVAPLPNDGRRAMGPGRPGHSSLSQSIEDSAVIHRREDGAFSAVTLVGLTRRPIEELVTLARSWLSPPPLALSSAGFSSEGYDRSERAYVLSREGAEPTASLAMTLSASEDSPLVHPGFVVRRWGGTDARLQIDGENVRPGERFRLGRRPTLEGTDLIVWVEQVATSPIEIRITPVGDEPGAAAAASHR